MLPTAPEVSAIEIEGLTRSDPDPAVGAFPVGVDALAASTAFTVKLCVPVAAPAATVALPQDSVLPEMVHESPTSDDAVGVE